MLHEDEELLSNKESTVPDLKVAFNFFIQRDHTNGNTREIKFQVPPPTEKFPAIEDRIDMNELESCIKEIKGD